MQIVSNARSHKQPKGKNLISNSRIWQLLSETGRGSRASYSDSCGSCPCLKGTCHSKIQQELSEELPGCTAGQEWDWQGRHRDLGGIQVNLKDAGLVLSRLALPRLANGQGGWVMPVLQALTSTTRLTLGCRLARRDGGPARPPQQRSLPERCQRRRALCAGLCVCSGRAARSRAAPERNTYQTHY